MSLQPLGANQTFGYSPQNNAFSPFNVNQQSSVQHQSDKFVKENNTLKKVVIGTGILAAIVVTLGALAKTGKLGDSAKEFMDRIFKPKNLDAAKNIVNPKATEATSSAAGTESAKLLKDAIKDGGIKFNKGIATLEDGSKFTGVIEGTSSGKKAVLEYADGKIMKSSIGDSTKVYSYTKDGIC